MTSPVQLSLEPEFRRGHGALYDALAAGRVDAERLFSLLAKVLPPLVDGEEARAWIAEHDVIDRGLLDRALSGLPGQVAQVRDACARWRRVRVAVDATAYPRPDAWCSPGREHVHNGACHCRGSSKTAPGWEYQAAAVTGHLRTAWAGVLDIQRTVPHRTAQTTPGRLPPRAHAGGQRRCSSSTPATAPPPSPTAWPAAPPTSWSGSPRAASSTRTRSPGTARTAGPPAAGRRSTA